MSASEREQFEKIVFQRSSSVGMNVQIPIFRPYSLPALQAAEVARNQGRFREFRSALFDAYWISNLNIGQLDVLADIASSVGIDTDDLKQQLAAATYVSVLESSLAEVAMIRRVVLPLFRWSGFVMYGLPRDYSRLRRLVELA